jgi:hypothetical protein
MSTTLKEKRWPIMSFQAEPEFYRRIKKAAHDADLSVSQWLRRAAQSKLKARARKAVVA